MILDTKSAFFKGQKRIQNTVILDTEMFDTVQCI